MGGSDKLSRMQALAEEGILGTTALITASALSTVLATVNSIVLARCLGPEGYGEYSLALTSTQLLLLGTGLGVPASVTYYASKLVSSGRTSEAVALVRRAALLTLFTSVLVAAAGAALLPLIMSDLFRAGEATKAAAIALPTVVIVPVLSVLSSYFVGVGKAGYSGAVSALREAARLPALIALATAAALTVERAALIYTAAYLLSLGAAIALLAKANALSGSQDRDAPKYSEMLAYGLPFYVASVLGGALGVYQNSLMARAASEVEVAGLRASMNVLAGLSALYSPIFSMAFPIFSKAAESESAQKVYRLAQGVSAAVVAPLLVYSALESGGLLELFYGRAYSPFEGYLLVLSLGSLPSVILGSSMLGGLLAGQGKPWAANSIGLVGLVSFLGASVPMAKLWGAFGIVLSVAASNCISGAYAFFIGRRLAGVSPDASVTLKVLLALVASAALTALARGAILFKAPLVVYLCATFAVMLGAYAVALSALRPFREYELDFLLVSIEGRGFVYRVAKILTTVYKTVPALRLRRRG